MLAMPDTRLHDMYSPNLISDRIDGPVPAIPGLYHVLKFHSQFLFIDERNANCLHLVSSDLTTSSSLVEFFQNQE